MIMIIVMKIALFKQRCNAKANFGQGQFMEHLEPAKLILKIIKDCWFNTDYTLSPGQWLVLQDWFMRLGPWHGSPP